MLKDLQDFQEIFSDDEFEERPVPLTEFVQSEDFLGLPPLSDEQFKLVQKMTTVYKAATLYKLYPEKEARKLSKGIVNEIISMIGKGGGKNHSTVVAVCYIIYQLLCLKDPAAYYGKPPGDAIDILNVATNATQANNTFFTPLQNRIKRCPWFEGKYRSRKNDIRFDKNITAHSGYSEREAWEGYNFLVVILDEIAGFRSEEDSTAASSRTATAAGLYEMYKFSLSSRFPDYGKLVLLSFTRYKGDFITRRFFEAVTDYTTKKCTYEFIINEDLPDDENGNKFSIDWDEYSVVTYHEPQVYAVHLPTWRSNPIREIENFKMDFYRNPVEALSRLACNPPDAIDAFFKDRERVGKAFSELRQPFGPGWTFNESFKPKDDTNYYIHIDLATKSDRAAVAMAHISGWKNLRYGPTYSSIEPIVTLDAVRWWTPKSSSNVEISEIKEYIQALKGRGFHTPIITTDRWAGSIALATELARIGIELETLSVDKQKYNDLSLLISEGRMDGYHVDLLVDELLALRVLPNGKVDHPRSGSNDLADAVCGAVHLAVANEENYSTDEIDVHYLDETVDITVPDPPDHERKAPPDVEMPKHLEEFLSRMKAI